MKKILFLSVLMLMNLMSVSAAGGPKIAGRALSRYTIVYEDSAEAEEGRDVAEALQRALEGIAGQTLPVTTAHKVKPGTRTIAFVHSPGIRVFDYSVKAGKQGLVIDAGGCWAMQKAADTLAAQLRQGDIPQRYQLEGTVEGQYLFPRREDVNLRILEDNIWDYGSELIPDVWQAAHLDCRDDARAPQFAQLVRAYMPDVVAFQEYNVHMHERLYPLLQKIGFTMANDPAATPWAHTPVLYNPQQLELIEAHNVLYTPEKWSNVGSKSYTMAVFKHKQTGKTFAIINTHLWYQKEKRQKGSNYARAAQVRLMMAEGEQIRDKYDCPIFVTGDMNCEESTIPIQQFLTAGYEPCYKAATVYGNRDNGHHFCSPVKVGARQSGRKSPEREKGAIDHCFIYNAKGTEVKIFDCIQAAFTVTLTDHYPNLIDAKL